ncbi:MAG: hypothetical protein PHX60_15085 [Giesbergeria sp.]|uniref:hypothetical protein n=1 Tax=Giesbergeria sp. TaxID=2818473 RepID=UPI0026176D1F|nr:hypothetical protein [Giesbergeria sp.]MDD2610976.1 hypothetical protein [Giesbergeria sp.]
MSELPFQKQAEYWGQAYEVLVKRGVLAYLLEAHLIRQNRPGLQRWREFKLLEISKQLCLHLDITDLAMRDVVSAATQHLAFTAYGTGYTTMRTYIDKVREHFKSASSLEVRALWCPLTLPGESTQAAAVREQTRQAFYEEFGLHGSLNPDWSRKGQPANSDFTLWLTSPGKRDDFLLVQEYSFNMPPQLQDFREQSAHLDELMRHRRRMDSRSVFARISAEVDGEQFKLSPDMAHHLNALTSYDKPLYKLCQASSYAESTLLLLQQQGLLQKACTTRALAITPHGLESLAARFIPEKQAQADPRCQLMGQLGQAYRQTQKLADGDDLGLQEQIEKVFRSMLGKLPAQLKKGMKALQAEPEAGQDYVFEFNETIANFANPTDKFSLDDAVAMVEESAELQNYFGGSARQAIGTSMRDLAHGAETLSLRDMHAAAIIAGMQYAKSGQLNVLALEGNPGIGKTTAIRTHLGKKEDGYLFLYVSPRVIINREVTHSLARNEVTKAPTGILTLTTHAALIAAAQKWHDQQAEQGLAAKRLIECTVVADGVPDLLKPDNAGFLVLTPEQEEQIDADVSAHKLMKHTLSEYEDLVQDRPLMGVLRGLALTSKELLARNPALNRLVLTAALQGFRQQSNQKTTIDALSKIFSNAAKSAAGRAERRAFAKRIPSIVVMVDELTGDGAGAPFVHAVAQWLSDEFIDCFEDADERSPFTVTLVVSDASLCNEVVLERYLNAGDRTPDKMLISKSEGDRPFRVAATPVRLARQRRQALHVMTNSFPASELHLHYRVKMTSVEMEQQLGQQETPRQAIRRVSAKAVLHNAATEVLNALDAGAQQVIYFAQDKAFLRLLQKRLCEIDSERLHDGNVHILDASVPGWRRKKLVEPQNRDQAKVFLMTSSGARGVSFPKTDWILASVPRFNVEAGLMEIAQLIYRGRGRYQNEHGEWVSGDNVPRHLVMLVDDYLVSEGRDTRQWLRQSLDLMTLLVTLRSTILTRITGDSDLRQKLALVPVGAVGVEELMSLMSQHVSEFVREAEIFKVQGSNRELQALAVQAQSNIQKIFSRMKLEGVPKRDSDKRTLARCEDMRRLTDLVASGLSPLLVAAEEGTSLANHISFSGPVVVESWADFAKQEIFSFEGHATQLYQTTKELMGQLKAIEEQREFPPVLRHPAANLRKLLQRQQHEAANEFSTRKELKSPHTWIALPAGYFQFLHTQRQDEGELFWLSESALWQEALGQTLNAGSGLMPPLAQYESFPWVATVGDVSPLKLNLVFDDRYFMASNELNLLNTLLLAKEQEQA